MNLFDLEEKKFKEKESPLASRIRPQTLEEFVGQEDIVGKDSLLYKLIKSDRISSIIFYGPPGTGKTTLAKIIANTTKAIFYQINATNAGIKDIKEIINFAKDNMSLQHKKTILFIDEIHRFNKSQQDSLLPHVESGTIILIGATTENPYFEVNSALVSRSTIIQLNTLTPEDIEKILMDAIHSKLGFGNMNIKITKEALELIASTSNGDARIALNKLELAILTTDPINNIINIDLDIIKSCSQKNIIGYDKNGDNHYNTISAFIKSMRGSDPNAAVYYLAKMLYSGEDPKFIARRLIICASEDVGLADNKSLEIAVNAFNAVNIVGMPEAKIILSHATIYIALAPKSNSTYMAINKAMADIENNPSIDIPMHLRDTHYSGSKDLKYEGYVYPHNFENNYTEQQYLPDAFKEKKYYEANYNGEESHIIKNYKKITNKQ